MSNSAAGDGDGGAAAAASTVPLVQLLRQLSGGKAASSKPHASVGAVSAEVQQRLGWLQAGSRRWRRRMEQWQDAEEDEEEEEEEGEEEEVKQVSTAQVKQAAEHKQQKQEKLHPSASAAPALPKQHGAADEDADAEEQNDAGAAADRSLPKLLRQLSEVALAARAEEQEEEADNASYVKVCGVDLRHCLSVVMLALGRLQPLTHYWRRSTALWR
jgi:hypothetical protein